MLSFLSTLAGTVSALAVLTSLIFVRRQIRQSVKNQRALIQQGRAFRSADIAMHLMNPDFAEAYQRCMNGDPDITPTQLVQFIGYARAVLLGAEDSFLQHRDGQLDESAFNSFRRSLLGVFVSPGMKTAWSILREWYDAEFAVFVDGIVRETADRRNVVQHELWKQHAQWKTAASRTASGPMDVIRMNAAA